MRWVIQGARALFRCRKIAVDAVAYAGSGGLDGVASEMGVAGRRLNLGMTPQLSDHRQRLAKRERTRVKGMTKIVDPHVAVLGACPDTPRGVLKVGEVTTGLPAGVHPQVVFIAGQGFQ